MSLLLASSLVSINSKECEQEGFPLEKGSTPQVTNKTDFPLVGMTTVSK